jgi:hypothetical protein
MRYVRLNRRHTQIERIIVMSQMIFAARMLQHAVSVTGARPKDGTTWYTPLALTLLGIAAVVASVYLGPTESGALL